MGSNAALEKAVQVVEQTRRQELGVLVLDYVNEEKDGTTRDEFRWGRWGLAQCVGYCVAGAVQGVGKKSLIQ